MKYVSSPVLTVLNVFEILLRRSNNKGESWEDTLCAVLPKRKMQRKQSKKEKLQEKSHSKLCNSKTGSDSLDEELQNSIDCSKCIVV